ncbi:MAG: ABC transporter ATP-binding protein, partial [Arenicellales bacterium]|nr:ABC transporter ATP-binding protein [Arenicellales bacterium]
TVVLLWMHWQLALFILLMNPVVVYFTTAMGKRVKDLKKTENQAFEVFQQALTETLDAIREVRAGNRERHYIRELIDRARGVKNHSASFSWKSDAANRVSFGIFLVGFDVFRAISMLMVVFSGLSIGQMLAVFSYLWFMMGPVQELLNIQYAYFAAKAALSRVNRLLELDLEPRYPKIHNPFQGKSTVAVRVEDVTFRYGEELVLRNVSLDIPAGEKVALVGASGGGKSTLVQVILGMYPAQSGHLYFDEVPVEEIGLDVVRDNVATVLQHPAMFNDSVRENLTLGRAYDEDKLWEALEVAQLHDIVTSMPHKLDTIIGNDGVRLSGGQQQRLAVARMVLANPKVVILDEATSALDNETEALLHKALSDYLHNRTTLIIAHRLSAVKQANHVYVFEDGHIIEQGTHEDLINSKGLYNKLYASAKQA